MLKFYTLLSIEPIKSVFWTIVKKRRFGMGPRTALSTDNDFYPAENMNVLSSTLVRLYRARLPLLSIELWASKMAGFGLMLPTSNWASKNLKTVFESTLFFIKWKFEWSFVKLTCNLTPGSKYRDMLQMSLCNRPKSWIPLLALSLFQRVMNPGSLWLSQPRPWVC